MHQLNFDADLNSQNLSDCSNLEDLSQELGDKTRQEMSWAELAWGGRAEGRHSWDPCLEEENDANPFFVNQAAND